MPASQIEFYPLFLAGLAYLHTEIITLPDKNSMNRKISIHLFFHHSIHWYCQNELFIWVESISLWPRMELLI